VARLTRSREAAKGNARGLAVVCVELPALLSTFSHLLSMAWMPWPPHPDPSPPFHGGEGSSGQWRGSREAAKPRRETHEGCCGVW
jgi:hypothetical protein